MADTMEPLLHVDLTVNPASLEEDARKVLALGLPDWNVDKTEFTRSKQGTVNCVVKCTLTSDPKAPALLLRVFGSHGPVLDACFNRQSEVIVLRVLAHNGLIPKVYFSFKNGVVVGWADGSVLSRARLLDDGLLHALAAYMHGYHHLAYGADLARPGALVFMDQPWKVLGTDAGSKLESSERFASAFGGDVGGLAGLRREVDRQHATFARLCAEYGTVYCHADVHILNIIQGTGDYPNSGGKVTFVDWEGSNWAPEVFDAAMLIDRDPTNAATFRDMASRRRWLSIYLSTHPRHRSSAPLSAALLERWVRDSLHASAISTFNIVSWCLAMAVQADGGVHEGAITHAVNFHRQYTEILQQIQALDSGSSMELSLPPLRRVSATVSLDAPEPGAQAVLAAIRPDWTAADVVMEHKKGAGNSLVKCTHTPSNETVMVRAFGDHKELNACFERDSEVEVFRVTSHVGLTQPLYCRFDNGVAYGYLEGDILPRKSLCDDSILTTICQLFHRIHNTDFESYMGGRRIARPDCMTFIDVPWEHILGTDFTFLTARPDFSAAFPPLAELGAEREHVRAVYRRLCDTHRVVYCHGDAHTHNIIYNESSGALSFVDWECSGWYPEIWDPTVLFDRTIYPEFTDAASRRHLMKVYLESNPNTDQMISEATVDAWYLDSLRCSLVSKWLAISFYLGASKTHHMGDILIDLAIKSYPKYLEMKAEIHQLEQKQA